MPSLIIYVTLLCFCYVHVHGDSYNENDSRDEIDLLKCKIEALEKSYKEQKQVIQQLEMREQQHNCSLTKVINEASKLSAYCQLLPTGICGECTCWDDYENRKKYYCDCQHLPPKRDCLEFLQYGYNKNGVYKINNGGIKSMQVYCDQETDNGGWAVFQRRVNGEIDFYRDWNMYKHGFGTLQREFWLGNDNIHALTLQALTLQGSELRIDMTNWNDIKKYVKYNWFRIDNETNNYMLHVTGPYGTAGDSFRSYPGHNKRGFQTYDSKDHNCSRMFRGAWWYSNCHYSNLNGEYRWFDEKQPAYARGVIWKYNYGYEYSLKHVEMKVRRRL